MDGYELKHLASTSIDDTREKRQRILPNTAMSPGGGRVGYKLCCSSVPIRKDHWRPNNESPVCFGCRRPFRLFYRRHHCRKCGKVYCFYCSGYKMRLDEDAKVSMEGRLHRVCLNCKRATMSMKIRIAAYSWKTDFMFMREKEHRFKTPIHRECLSFYSDFEYICGPALDVFQRSNGKNTKKIVKAVGGALKATVLLTYVCLNCDRDLVNPTKRKQCVICNETFCEKCTYKELVIYSESTKDNRETKIAISNEIKKFKDEYPLCRAFRLCVDCKTKVQMSYDKAVFNDKINTIHRTVSHLKFKIKEAFDEMDDGIERRTLDTRQECNQLSDMRTYSVECLDGDLDDLRIARTSGDIKASGSIIINKLMDEYFNQFQYLLQLIPSTRTQQRLFINFKWEMRYYYGMIKEKYILEQVT